MLVWGTHLIRSSAYHPQIDGQTERVNQIVEDMLRACVLAYPQKWDECLPLEEFSYNNSYQESIRMAPFEALYSRSMEQLLRRRSYLGEREISEVQVSGPFKHSSRYFIFEPSRLLYSLVRESRDEILLRGKGCNTLVLIAMLIMCLTR